MDYDKEHRCRPAARRLIAFALRTVIALAIPACTSSPDPTTEPRHPQQAGQPASPYAIAGHVAAAQANLIANDPRAAQSQLKAAATDMTRAMRIPDPARPIDHEAARAAVRPISGVRTSLWLDRTNFVVMVGGQQQRSMAMIDHVCLALEPLGDTLAVVVNVQDVTAKNADGATTLSRNCQLQEGERALLQGKREVDVVPKELRGQFKAMQQRRAIDRAF